MKRIKISAKSARLEFNGCTLDYMGGICYGRCCDAPSDPNGCKVVVTPQEAEVLKHIYDIKVEGNFIVSGPNKKCPFKLDDHLCELHTNGLKPLGCLCSPFTINTNGTLVIKNRNKMLKCFKAEPKIPAYKAYKLSLMAMFGIVNTDKITEWLDDEANTGFMFVEITNEQYNKLRFVVDAHHE